MFLLIAQAADSQVVDIAAQAGSISSISTVGQLIQMAAAAILIIGGLAFLLYLLMGGINWITAGGDKTKVEHAREMITQGIIGIAILASVFALYGVVLRFLGIRGISLGGGGNSPATTSARCGTYCAGTDQCAEIATKLCSDVGYSFCSKNTYPCVRGK